MSTKSNIVRIEIPTSSSIFIRSNTNRETVVTIQHDNEENNVVIIASPERNVKIRSESSTHSPVRIQCQVKMCLVKKLKGKAKTYSQWKECLVKKLKDKAKTYSQWKECLVKKLKG
ncbi:hypothetical protein M8J75_009031 [Diaphorina citri]|nr:hypothetical protein M8J75_009031 [Diaphorina citri]